MAGCSFVVVGEVPVAGVTPASSEPMGHPPLPVGAAGPGAGRAVGEAMELPWGGG